MQYLLYNINVHVIIFYEIPSTVHRMVSGGLMVFGYDSVISTPGLVSFAKRPEREYILHLLCSFIVII